MRPRRLVRYGTKRCPTPSVFRVDVRVQTGGDVFARYVGGPWGRIGFADTETMLRGVLRCYRPTREAAIKAALRVVRLDVKVARKALAVAEAELAAVLALRKNKASAKK